MRLKQPKKDRVYVNAYTKHALKYMAYSMGLSMGELLEMAVREFAARRLQSGWEEVILEDEDWQSSQAKEKQERKDKREGARRRADGLA